MVGRNFSGVLLLALLSGCSEVSLSYGSGTVLPVIQPGGNNSTVAPAASLSGLNILGRIQSDPDSIRNLRLRLSLKHPLGAEMNRSVEVSVADFLKDPTLNWLNLTPGQAELKVELLGPDNQVLSQVLAPVSLLNSASQSFSFDLNGGASPSLQLSGSSPTAPSGSTNGSSPAGSGNPSPTPNNPDSPASPTPNPGSPSGGSSSTPESDLKARTVSRTDSTATVLWDAPTGQTVTGYRILIDGKEVAANHPVANYNFTNLNRDLPYTIQIIPLLANGTSLPADVHNVSKAEVSSGGGGGGGGGGGTPAVNTPPVINSLTPSNASLSGLGYPTRITASASDDQVLADSAYTWSCLNCGDASFNRTDSPQVIWTAPSTQVNPTETYTLQLSVSDGVNPPVTSTTTVTVNRQLANVNVNGEYR